MAEPTEKELTELRDIARELIPDSKLRDFESEVRMMVDRPNQEFRFLSRVVEASEAAKVKNYLTDDVKVSAMAAAAEKEKKDKSKKDGEGAREARDRASKNPWRKENWNFTEQNRICKAIGESAARELCEAAGVKWGATRPAS